MATSDEYRAKAAEMRRLASGQVAPDIRADFEKMAHGWEAMARRRLAEEARQTKPK